MRRTGTDLTVEREVEDPRGVRRRYRLTARMEAGEGEPAPGASETAKILESLSGELDAALTASGVIEARSDRPIAELVEAYHPRQSELIDLLLEEGEISPVESGRLKEFLTSRSPASAEPAGIPVPERPLAAAPLAVDRTPSTPRPVEELIRLYRIESLKQAGAVRGRRQISYEEYMALKRHFSGAEAAASGPPAPSG